MKVVLFNILLLISIFIFVYLVISFITFNILWIRDVSCTVRLGFIIIVLGGYIISACLTSNN